MFVRLPFYDVGYSSSTCACRRDLSKFREGLAVNSCMNMVPGVVRPLASACQPINVDFSSILTFRRSSCFGH